jgi:hypothetical protein
MRGDLTDAVKRIDLDFCQVDRQLKPVEDYHWALSVLDSKVGGGSLKWYVAEEDLGSLDGVGLEGVFYGVREDGMSIVCFAYDWQKPSGRPDIFFKEISATPGAIPWGEFCTIHTAHGSVSAFGVCGFHEAPVAMLVWRSADRVPDRTVTRK